MHLLFCIWILTYLTIATSTAETLHVGALQQYTSVQRAASEAMPGDTVLIHNGQYEGTFWIENVRGRLDAWITIRGESVLNTVFRGGTESMHFSDCEFVKLENFTVTAQTGNGLNIDDDGTIETPASHLYLRNIAFVDMNATGNNDFLKMSGVDHFVVDSCTFTDGSEGGSGIDMVGCHSGRIVNCKFNRLGSNCIQAKGGTSEIRIENNWFIDGGQRSVNLGGSTGLQFFRPIDATYEATNLKVYANMFVRSVAPIAFVGCTNVDVANNTIIDPERWVIRILQETVDASRFAPCGNNTFRNNIVYFTSGISTVVNIGPNTDPTSFTFTNNMWYNRSNPAASIWSSPEIAQANSTFAVDPMFVNATDADYHFKQGSEGIGGGVVIDSIDTDMDHKRYADPPSLGAYEYIQTTDVMENGERKMDNDSCAVFRVQGAGCKVQIQRLSVNRCRIIVPECKTSAIVREYDLLGRELRIFHLLTGEHTLNGTFFMTTDN